MATTTLTEGALLRLLQLASAALPVGGYAFSQALEMAVELRWVSDEADTDAWLRQQLQYSVARVDVPLLLRLHRAACAGDVRALVYYNGYCLACRETAELRLTDTAMGEALCRLLRDLGEPVPPLAGEISYTAAFAWTCAQRDIDAAAASHGYLWSWLENQVAAATKLVPLGQASAQRLLGALLPLLAEAHSLGAQVADDDIGASLPALALASSWHETQYTRLFRS